MLATSPLTDRRLKEAVVRQLEWDPAVDARHLEVSVEEGVVVLRGHVDTYSGATAAEKAAKHAHGVRGVVNLIDVQPSVDRLDEDIAADAVCALHLHQTVPHGVEVAVKDGCLTLSGRVDWPYQRRTAERAVRDIRGIRSVRNAVVVAPRAAVRDLQHRIVRALHQNADVDARRIKCTVAHDCATLSGTVGSWLQREVAERAAADCPGIGRVINQIAVEPADQSRDTDEIC